MAKLRSAILGCGPRAEYHARVYDWIKDHELVACCDLDEKRLHRFGDRFGIAGRYGDLRTMLEEARPDLLHIVTAPNVRWSVVEAALDVPPRGMLIEKPLACTPSEGRRIFHSCQEAGVALFVNHQLRHHMPHLELREVVRSGDLGDIEWVRASCRGNLLEQGTHLFDLVSFLFDDPAVEWILAQATGADGFHQIHACPSYAAGTVSLNGGPRVMFECGASAPTWRCEPKFWYNVGVEIVGAKGRAGASINHGWWRQVGSELLEYPVAYDEEDDRAQGRLIESILDALAGGDEKIASHPNNAQRSIQSFALVMAAQRSALHRVPIRPNLSDVSDEEIDRLRAELASSEAVGVSGHVHLEGA